MIGTAAIEAKFGQFLGRTVRVRWRAPDGGHHLMLGVLRWAPPYLHLHRVPLAQPTPGNPPVRRGARGYLVIGPATVDSLEVL